MYYFGRNKWRDDKCKLQKAKGCHNAEFPPLRIYQIHLFITNETITERNVCDRIPPKCRFDMVFLGVGGGMGNRRLI